MITNPIYVLILLILVSSCTSLRPVLKYESESDYNMRREFSGARFQKRTNPIGIAATLGATAGGAYLGYKQDLIILQNNEGQRVANKPAGAVLGGLVGFGLSSLANYLISGQEKYVPIATPNMREEWLRKYDRQMIDLKNPGSLSTILAIDEKAGNNYLIKTFEDTRHFFSAFPNSIHKEKIFNTSVPIANREQLLELLSFYPNAGNAEAAKTRYSEISKNLDELLEASTRFSSLKYDFEKKAADLVRSYPDLEKFFNKYSVGSSYTKTAFINSFKNTYEKNQVVSVSRWLGSGVELGNKDIPAINFDQLRNYTLFRVQLQNVTNLEQLIKVFANIQWVSYPEKGNDFLEYAWNICYPQYKDGNKMVGDIFAQSSKLENSFLNISNDQFSDFLFKKLSEEVKKFVRIENAKVQETLGGTDFDVWEESLFYDAPYVRETGDIRYLYHGTVANSSKFDLPLKFLFIGKMTMKMEEKLLGVDMFAVANFFTALTGQKDFMANPEFEFDPKRVYFYIPLIKPGERVPFAVLFDYGKGTSKQGIQIMGLQATLKNEMKSIEQAWDVTKERPTLNQLNIQRFWVEQIGQELGTKKVKELFGNEYDPQDYVIQSLSKEDYQERYGRDCGCTVVSDKEEGFLLKDGYQTVRFKNGGKQEYSFLKSGKYQIHDGFLGFMRTEVNTYAELLKVLTQECLKLYCR